MRYGTLSFGEVASAAVRFADQGFVMYPLKAHLIAQHEAGYAEWPGNREVYLPGGRPPRVGEVFFQKDLGRTLQYMVDEEAAVASKGREAGLKAARDAFYVGDIARTIVAYHEENGGFLTAEDMADYRVTVEPPVSGSWRDHEVLTCGAWCQGPTFIQILNILEGYDLVGMGHNSPDYVHTLIEAVNLVFADRERYYGDPRFVDVPLDELLSEAYAKARRRLIHADSAWTEMPPAGDPYACRAVAEEETPQRATGGGEPNLDDTSYVCAVDSAGNVFSATPSDNSHSAPLVPGTGLVPSGRGSQSRIDRDHPSSLAPGKRPRLTPNPALVMKDGKPVMPIGTPGGDVQVQAMVQVFLNMRVFGMEPLAAVEAPRFASFNFPNSFAPYAYLPGRVSLEGRIDPVVGERLSELGNDVQWWPEATYLAGAVCTILVDHERGTLAGASDYRRSTGTAGW